MGIKEIAKLLRRWFLGCDYSLDYKECEEDNEQCRSLSLFIGEKGFNRVYEFGFWILARTVPE
nr:hypothetical protein [Tanacetum cinerariifolium]